LPITHKSRSQPRSARTFVYNGDNKQTEVKRGSEVVGRYFYDGEGKRIKKQRYAGGVLSEETVFVYSSGKLIAEYSNQVSQAPTVAYTTTDHLGSPRIITDQYGQVRSRRDFMPFGEDIFQNVGARTASLSYSTSQDDLRQKFTGYQKDSETQLDFAEARMYENRFGRFTAVDPLMSSANISSPQTWNRYNYCGGNPIACTDPSGMDGLWGMQYREGRVKLKFFKSQEEMAEENKILDTPFCREMANCVGWERWDREYFLYENQSVSHLSSNGVKTDFSVATIGQEYWGRLVDDFYSPAGFSEWGSQLLKSLYEGQLRQDQFDRILGVKENPNHLEMGGNPIRAARDAIRALKYTIGDYSELQKRPEEQALMRIKSDKGPAWNSLFPDMTFERLLRS
jgi:RHS repeat-associated protein